jgi:hypothetical protein
MKLGQLLVARGAITGEQLIRAIQSQRALGGRIGTCLLEMDVLSEDHLLDALSHQLAVPAATIEELRQIKDNVLELVPARVAVRCQAIPFAASDSKIQVATLNVHHLTVLDELAFCSNRRVVPHIANEVRIAEALEKHYGHQCTPRFGHLLDRLNRSRYLWDESAKILLGAAAPMEWQGIEVLEAQWNDQRSLMRPAASRSQRAASQRSNSPKVVLPGVVPAVAPGTTLAGTTPPRAAGSVTLSEIAPQAFPPQTPNLATPRRSRRLGLEDFERLLALETDRERIGEVILRFLGQFFSRAALFRVSQDKIRGWMARGVGVDSWMFKALELSLGEPSIFRDLARGSDLYIGSMQPLPNHVRLAQVWGGELPQNCLFIPLRIRSRLVSVLYGDCDVRGLGEVDIEVLRKLSHKATAALESCILKKKLNQL